MRGSRVDWLRASLRIHRDGDLRRRSIGGVLSSRLVDAAKSGDDKTITLMPGGTVVDALNEIARQSGQGWLVITEERPGHTEPEITAVGLIHREGTTTNPCRGPLIAVQGLVLRRPLSLIRPTRIPANRHW